MQRRIGSVLHLPLSHFIFRTKNSLKKIMGILNMNLLLKRQIAIKSIWMVKWQKRKGWKFKLFAFWYGRILLLFYPGLGQKDRTTKQIHLPNSKFYLTFFPLHTNQNHRCSANWTNAKIWKNESKHNNFEKIYLLIFIFWHHIYVV